MVCLVVAHILGLGREVVDHVVVGRRKGVEEVDGLCMVVAEDW